MNIVLDANILFSALIKDSKTRELILGYDDFFFFPSYIFIEMEEHKKELLKKSGMSAEDFNELLQLLLKKMVIVPNESLIPFKEKADSIVKGIDPDDSLFIACALAYPPSCLWSDDKSLKKQNKVKVFETKEIIRLINE